MDNNFFSRSQKAFNANIPDVDSARIKIVALSEAIPVEYSYSETLESEHLKWVSEGDVERCHESYTREYSDLCKRAGSYADSMLKHYEYSSVIQVALYSMAAVQGGLNARTALALREYFCRDISKSSTATEYISIGYEALITYAELVRELRSALTGNKYVDRAKAIIQDAIDKPLTVSTLAQEMGISPDYLSKMFKRLTGNSLKKYITDQKMKLAGNLLRHTSYSVADICLLCGVGSQNYFCKLFKSKFGVTPFEYQKP